VCVFYSSRIRRVVSVRTFLGSAFGQIVHLPWIQHILKLAQDPISLSSSALWIDKHQQRAAQFIRRRYLKMRRLAMMMHL